MCSRRASPARKSLPENSEWASSNGPVDAGNGFEIESRSRVVTDGIEAKAPRGMPRAAGRGDDDGVNLQIGIATSSNETTSWNLSFGRIYDMATRVRIGCSHLLQFGTGCASDGL